MVESQEKISPQEEIQKLEQQLEQKKRKLAQTGAQVPQEKELFREVLKDHVESLRSPTPPPSGAVPLASIHDEKIDREKAEAHEATVRMLVEKALTGTIEDAVREAEKISPYILDELHDHLVDPLYRDKLLALRKIKQL